MKKNNLKLHFFYIVGFLVLALIITATGLWTDRPNFTEFLSNAATMTSIVLGLVAIFYSFISNSSLATSLSNILFASERISNTGEQVEKFLVKAEDLNKSSSLNTEAFKNVSLSLEGNLNSLKLAMDEIKEQSIKLQENITLIPGRIDKLESTFSKANEPKSIDEKKHRTWSEEEAKSYLDRSPLSGNFFIYACKLAFNTNQEISLENLTRVFGTSTTSFINGFRSASQAAGLIKTKLVKQKSRTFMITEIDESLLAIDIRAYIENYLKNDSSFEGDELSQWLERITLIEKEFNLLDI